MNKKTKDMIKEIRDNIIDERYDNVNLRQNLKSISSYLDTLFEIQNDVKEIKENISVLRNEINIDNEIDGANFNDREMDENKYILSINDMLNYCKDLLINTKLNEYANTENVFKTFNEAAELQEITPEQALYGMMAKHIGSVKNMLNNSEKELALMIENDAEGGKYSLDKWKEKIGDNISYLLILYAMINSRINE